MKRLTMLLAVVTGLLLVDTKPADARLFGGFFRRGSCGKKCDRCHKTYYCGKSQHCCACGGVDCHQHKPNSAGQVSWDWGRRGATDNKVTVKRKDGTKVTLPIRAGTKFNPNPAPVPVPQLATKPPPVPKAPTQKR